MKKSLGSTFLFVTMFLFLTKISFAQQDVPKLSLTQEDYLKKSKRQKTAAWIFTGVGVTVTLVSIAALAGSGYNYTPGESGPSGDISSLIGVASIGTGVYFFIASGKNKRRARAASVFIDMEKFPVLKQTLARNNSYPALGMRIRL